VASFSIPHLLQPLLLRAKSFSKKKQQVGALIA
jgi:hypothetical protein